LQRDSPVANCFNSFRTEIAAEDFFEGVVVVQELMSDSELGTAFNGEHLGVIGQCTAALMGNATGRYGDALIAAERACEYVAELGISTLVLPELIEAASRCGRIDRASEALHQLAEATAGIGSDWALGIESRSRALMSSDAAAESLYLRAIDLLGRTHMRIELARAHLLYGEWLRRGGRRVDARSELRAAFDIFTAVGIEPFAERARRELLATGETVRKRTVETRFDLTAQETHIAQLAGGGHTNSEIATELFISPRTVEWHLRKVYTKLGVTSRRHLRVMQPDRLRTTNAVS
jgi:DNA-binding CsgD family transcriptional regulator